MSTRYVYEYRRKVTVTMADEGETYEGEPVKWEPGEQEGSAREYAMQALPLFEEYAEDWVEIEDGTLAKVEP